MSGRSCFLRILRTGRRGIRSRRGAHCAPFSLVILSEAKDLALARWYSPYKALGSAHASRAELRPARPLHFRRAREGELDRRSKRSWPRPRPRRAILLYSPNRMKGVPAPNGMGAACAAASRARGDKLRFSPLVNHPFSLFLPRQRDGRNRPSRHPSVGILRMKYGGQARELRTAGFAFVCDLGWCILPIENAGHA